MKLAYIVTGLQVGGAELMVCELALGMHQRGHEVSVTSLLEPRAYADRLEDAGVAVHTLNMRRRQMRPAAVVQAATRYRKRIASEAPAIVHAHMVHANLFARLALALRGTPLVCTIHNTYEGGRLRDFAYALTNWASNLDTTVSEAATRRYVGDHVLPRKTLTIHNGIDTARYTPPLERQSSGRFRWLAVGRLDRQKDYPLLLQALALVADATLDIAGEGPARGQLESLVTTLGLGERVRFLGVRHDIPQLLSEHDGFVLSSAWEGFGLAVAEAMAAGLPVVATDSGGPAEILGRDGACGLLVPPGDIAALVTALRNIGEMSVGQRAAMGQRGRERVVSQFDRAVMLDRWEAIYDALSRGAPVTAPAP